MSRFWATLLAVALVGSLVMNLFGPGYREKIWDVPAFFAVYGFVGCVVIIYVSKWLGKKWLLQDPGYYAPYRAPREVAQEGAEPDPMREDAGDV